MSIARTRKKRAKPWTPAEASVVVDELEASGMQLEQFAISKGVSPSRLGKWRRRLGREPRSKRLPAEKLPAENSQPLTPAAQMVELLPTAYEAHATPVTAAKQEPDERVDLLVTLRSGHQIRLEASWSSRQLHSLIEVLDGLGPQGG